LEPDIVEPSLGTPLLRLVEHFWGQIKRHHLAGTTCQRCRDNARATRQIEDASGSGGTQDSEQTLGQIGGGERRCSDGLVGLSGKLLHGARVVIQ
jgi:hypothetical protein